MVIETPANELKIPTKPMSGQEFLVSMHGGAVLSNKIFAENTSAGVRIAFCEINSSDVENPHFRAAVLLSYPDAAALRDLLSHQLSSVQFLDARSEEPKPDG